MSFRKYNLFIGEHMIEPLRVKVAGKRDINNLDVFNVVGMQVYEGVESVIISSLFGRQHVDINNCQPIFRDPKSLSNDEWLYIFCGDDLEAKSQCFIDRDNQEESIYVRYKGVNYSHYYNMFFFDIMFEHCDQQILNRMYSLHCIPNFQELKDKGFILEKED